MNTQRIATTVESAIRELLERKHLYQSVEVDVGAAVKQINKHASAIAAIDAKEAENWPWVTYDTDSLQALLSLTPLSGSRVVSWKQPDVKLFCKLCDRIEPYNGISASNVLNKSDAASGGILQRGKLVQTFCLTYLCQSCKSVPEVFLVRRVGTRFSLVGRSPMEHVTVPKSIPKEVSSFYTDAVVAFNSGQTLAALFLFRTLCEQWARRFASPEDKADIALDKYMGGLPDDFKGRFPSLRTIYGNLSMAIHSASASDELFLSTRESIDEHFSARSLFKLSGMRQISVSGL